MSMLLPADELRRADPDECALDREALFVADRADERAGQFLPGDGPREHDAAGRDQDAAHRTLTHEPSPCRLLALVEHAPRR
jgi:hypothetical protein